MVTNSCREGTILFNNGGVCHLWDDETVLETTTVIMKWEATSSHWIGPIKMINLGLHRFYHGHHRWICSVQLPLLPCLQYLPFCLCLLGADFWCLNTAGIIIFKWFMLLFVQHVYMWTCTCEFGCPWNPEGEHHTLGMKWHTVMSRHGGCRRLGKNHALNSWASAWAS